MALRPAASFWRQGHHPWSLQNTDHRHAALPPERREPRYVVWPQRFGSTSPWRSRGGSRDQGARLARHLLRRSWPLGSSRFTKRVTHLHSTRTDLHQVLSRAESRAFGDCRRSGLRARTSERAHPNTHSCGERPPTSSFRQEIGSPTINPSGEARSLAAFMYAMTGRIAKALDEGERPLPAHVCRGEPLARDQVRADQRDARTHATGDVKRASGSSTDRVRSVGRERDRGNLPASRRDAAGGRSRYRRARRRRDYTSSQAERAGC